MMIVRPIAMTDLPALEETLTGIGVGMTSLPSDHDYLQRRIELSLRSFAAPPHEWPSGGGEEFFFFVLEDTTTGRIVGTTAVKSGIGLGEPFYSYRVGTVVHASRELGVHKILPTLYLANDYTGCAEIGSLFLRADYRRGGLGKLLSKCRFLFLAEFARRFPDKVIAEMRGVSDAAGNSPFWDGLGQHFFSIPFSHADFLSGTRGKTFIAELMPHNPIYLALLPPQAQTVIGRVHDDTRPALRLLEDEGFHYEGYVDIFDAGPTLEARVRDIRAVRESRRLPVELATVDPDAPRQLVANTQWHGFRATLAPVEVQSDRVRIGHEPAEGLAVGDGDPLRVVAVTPRPPGESQGEKT